MPIFRVASRGLTRYLGLSAITLRSKTRGGGGCQGFLGIASKVLDSCGMLAVEWIYWGATVFPGKGIVRSGSALRMTVLPRRLMASRYSSPFSASWKM